MNERIEELEGVTAGLLQALVLLRAIHPDQGKLQEAYRRLKPAFPELMLAESLSDRALHIAQETFESVFESQR